MIRTSYVILFVVLTLSACQKSEKETPSGLTYKIIEEGNGEVPKEGDIIIFDYELKDNNDSVWSTSLTQGMSAAIQVQPKDTTGGRKTDPMVELISMLSIGDSVTTSLSTKEFFTKLIGGPVPKRVDSTGTLTYSLRTKDAMTMEEFNTWRETTVTARDEKMITDYLAENNLEAERDSSGLYYILYNNTGGAKPEGDNCVRVKYEGRFLQNGRVFDSNENLSYPLNRFIEGWKIGIAKLSPGDSATLFVPSRLAYGNRGSFGMPPDAVLIFDVTLHEFKNTFDPATKTCK